MNDSERQEKVKALCEAGQADEALNVFRQIHDKDYKLGLVRKIVEAYCEIECPEQAVLLLNQVDKHDKEQLAERIAIAFCEKNEFAKAIPYWKMGKEYHWPSCGVACHVLAGQSVQAAQLVAQQAEGESGWSQQSLWYQAGKLWEKTGKKAKESKCYAKAGCNAKANRVRGGNGWQIEETLASMPILGETDAPPPIWEAELYHFLGDCNREFKLLVENSRAEEFFSGFYSHNTTVSNVLRHHFGPPELIQALEQQGKHEEARKVKRKVESTKGVLKDIKKFGDPPIPDNDCDSHAIQLLNRGSYEEVLKLYELVGRATDYSDHYQKEVEPFLDDANYMIGNFHEALRWHKRRIEDPAVSKQSTLKRALFELATEDFESTIRTLRSFLDRKNKKSLSVHAYGEAIREFVCHIGTIHSMSGDIGARANCFKEAEDVERKFGIWIPSVKEYFQRGLFEEMERVCREEDELDVAAYLYEKAGKTEDAARIYEEMAGIPSTVADGEENTKKKRVVRKTATTKCPICGYEVLHGDNFCSNCGHRLCHYCPGCGAEITEEKKFCGKCGAEFN